MKIRNGFVSNSSSSSFVFGLPKGKQTVEDIKDLMFPHGVSYWEDTINGWVAAEGLKRDMEPFDPKRNIYQWEEDGWKRKEPKDRPRYMIFDDYDTEIGDMIEACPNYDFFIVEYEDHTSYGSAMEHGDHWDNVPCVRMSHH